MKDDDLFKFPRNQPASRRGEIARQSLRQGSEGSFFFPGQGQRFRSARGLIQLIPQLLLRQAESLRGHPMLPRQVLRKDQNEGSVEQQRAQRRAEVRGKVR